MDALEAEDVDYPSLPDGAPSAIFDAIMNYGSVKFRRGWDAGYSAYGKRGQICESPLLAI